MGNFNRSKGWLVLSMLLLSAALAWAYDWPQWRGVNRDGHLYLHGEEGEVALIEALPEAYRERGRFVPPDQPKHGNPMEKAWAYPVIADGKLYIRDLNMLWCYDIKAKK